MHIILKNTVILMILLCVVGIVKQSFAQGFSRGDSFDVLTKRVNNSNGSALTNFVMTAASTVTTETILQRNNVGFSSILATENASSGLGSVSIISQYSNDGVNFYTPYTTSGGVLTADSNIVTTLASATRLIAYTPRLGQYTRFQIVSGAASQITLDYWYQVAK